MLAHRHQGSENVCRSVAFEIGQRPQKTLVLFRTIENSLAGTLFRLFAQVAQLALKLSYLNVLIVDVSSCD